MRFKKYKYKSVTSTNDVAVNLIKKEKKDSGCVYSDLQTKGRGTHGKKWISQKGNLFTSIFFHLKENYPSFSEFSIINPIIISEVVKIFCRNENVKLKYPNDIFVNGKKICGILQELIILDDRKFLIVGVGMNVVKNPGVKNKYETTSIFKESKKKRKISEIINMIILSYENFFLKIKSYKYLNFKKKADLMAISK